MFRALHPYPLDPCIDFSFAQPLCVQVNETAEDLHIVYVLRSVGFTELLQNSTALYFLPISWTLLISLLGFHCSCVFYQLSRAVLHFQTFPTVIAPL